MDKTRLIENFGQQIPVFSELIEALRTSGLTAWLVGGCVRDLLLDKECADVDIVSTEDPSEWARRWAKGRGSWFWLDEQRMHSRILLADGISFDFSPLRAATIVGDLSARDFTINAIAVPLNKPAFLLDPLNGIADLKCRRLRMCSNSSFSADPLRILKGIRHSAVLNFTIEDQTIAAMKQQAQQLKQVAPERIREELLKIVVIREISYALQIISLTTVLQVLLGQPETSWSERNFIATHQSLFDHFDEFCGQHQLAVSKVLQQQRPVFCLTALVMAYAPQRFSQIYPELCLSRTQQRLLSALRDELPGPWLQQLRQISSDRQRALVVEQLHPCGEERVFYHGWCRRQLDDETVIILLRAYKQQQQNNRIPDLLNGHVILQYTSANNRIVGWLLQQIKTQEIAGRIHSADDAIGWLRGHFGFDKN